MSTSRGRYTRKMTKDELRRYGVGRVIADRYEIVEMVGAGAMAVVWLARDRRGESLFWAVKEMLPSVSGRDRRANRAAMLAEAHFIQRLDNPAIPRVTEIINAGSDIFVVMDYIDGESLRDRMMRQGHPFSQEEAIDWGIQLCDVLGYLHRGHQHAGTGSLGSAKADFYPIVYRDLKPANVVLRSDGSAKLIDFGIAVELVPDGTDAFGAGTPGYSAPEQLDVEMHRKHPADARADIYALGTTLYSLVTGLVPKAATRSDGSKEVDFALRPIREANPRLSDGLEKIIWRATRPDPQDRYQDIEEMRYDLAHYEELTQEHQMVQRRKVAAFRARLACATICAVVGVICIAAAFAVRASSYDSLVARANAASTDEPDASWLGDSDGAVARMAEPSDAERLYTQAVQVNPTDYEAYAGLIDTYEVDGAFAPAEEQRWQRLWQEHGVDLEGHTNYGRVCFDIGIAYLCYYDFADVRGSSGPQGIGPSGTGMAIAGQGAIENATRSAAWFDRASEAYGADAEASGLSDREYAATQAYGAIASFHTMFSKGSLEGSSGDLKRAYGDFWHSLCEIVPGYGRETAASRSDDMVKLRLYQVAFEALCSPTYLAGFRDNAQVTQEEAEQLLEVVSDGTANLAGFVRSMSATGDSTSSAQVIYDEITGNEQLAAEAINVTFNGTTARAAQDDAARGADASAADDAVNGR